MSILLSTNSERLRSSNKGVTITWSDAIESVKNFERHFESLGISCIEELQQRSQNSHSQYGVAKSMLLSDIVLIFKRYLAV